MHYLPSLASRCHEVYLAWSVARHPPPLALRQGDAVIVCDAIEAYRSLFAASHVAAIRRLVRRANEQGIPVVFTSWSRTDKHRGDAVDAKGHWSDYIPASQRGVLRELEAARVVDVHFTNALCHPRVREAIQGCTRLVLAGGWGESCVLHTARAATEEYATPPQVVANATVGHPIALTCALVQLQLLYADVTSV